MAEGTPKPPTDLEELERFVVYSDDLLALEERIGRFNIFDALDIARVEIRHSNFLAWLLDPAESHGQGALFLSAVLMDLFKNAPAEKRPLSPVDLDGTDLQGVEIRREWRSIDMLIVCKQPQFVIAIENKIGSGEHSSQLERYRTTIERDFHNIPRERRMFVYLTTDASEPSSEDWVPYSYAHIHRVLERCQRINQGAIGADVSAFIAHYLRLIGSRFMDNPGIDELCQKIYRNHRHALDLIFERVGTASAGLPADIAELIAQRPDRWHVLNHTTQVVSFVPKNWLTAMPPLGVRKTFDPRCWLIAEFSLRSRSLTLAMVVWPMLDPALRRTIIERLTADRKEFGFRLFSKKIVSDAWTRVCREQIEEWDEDEGPDSEKVLAAVAKKLDELEKRWAGVAAALKPIFDRSPQSKVE